MSNTNRPRQSAASRGYDVLTIRTFNLPPCGRRDRGQRRCPCSGAPKSAPRRCRSRNVRIAEMNIRALILVKRPILDVRESIVRQAREEKGGADRKEQPLRRIERADLDDDEQKAHAVPQRAHMALADAARRPDRYVGHAEAGAKEAHRDRRGVGKPIWQQVEKLAELVRLHHAKTGGQILDVLAYHPTCHATEQVVGNAHDARRRGNHRRGHPRPCRSPR